GFGGNAGLPQRVDNVSLELSEELSWLPGGGAHRPKLGGLLSGTGLDQNQTPNQLGTFVFPSLSALAADSPASFSRVFAPVVQGGTAWNGALYLADSWRTGGLQVTYGTRLESARFSGAPPYNRAVDSLFALRTDRIPEHTRLSPRIGFMWTGGGGEDGGGGPTTLRGGAGAMQSPTPPAHHRAGPGRPGRPNPTQAQLPHGRRGSRSPTKAPARCTCRWTPSSPPPARSASLLRGCTRSSGRCSSSVPISSRTHGRSPSGSARVRREARRCACRTRSPALVISRRSRAAPRPTDSPRPPPPPTRTCGNGRRAISSGAMPSSPP